MIDIIKSIDISTWIFVVVGLLFIVSMFAFHNKIDRFLKTFSLRINYFVWKRWNKKNEGAKKYGNDDA